MSTEVTLGGKTFIINSCNTSISDSGLVTGRVVYLPKPAQYIKIGEEGPIKGSAHPLDNRLTLEKAEMDYTEGEGSVVATYTGMDTANLDPSADGTQTVPVYSFDYGLSEEPIETHPKFAATAGTPDAPINGAVFMKRDHSVDKDSDPIEEWKTNRFVCTYLHRPKSKDEYCEDMLLMSIYYGCKMCPEINVPAIMDHFNRRGYQGYLHYVLDKKTGRYKKNPGYNTGATERESIFRAYQSFIENHGARCVHDDLLTQCLEIGEDMGDYDLFVAGGMCLLGVEDENSFYFGDNEDEGDEDDIDNYFQSRDY